MKPPIIHLGIAALLAILAIGGYVLWYGHVQALDAEAATLAGEIAVKDADRVRSVSARSAEAELALQEAFIASHLVATADIVVFLEQLEKTGRDFGATLQVASVTGGEPATDGRISLSLSITGPFNSVMRTLGAIETGPYAGMVQDLSLNGSAEGEWTATGVFVIGTMSTP
ncbi:MAG TPA: hypothetical protein PK109_01890 [Candidatus Paceibacterota bacterium]|nr:hypothetical protein [Candidatus Paceibacterota bacterium]